MNVERNYGISPRDSFTLVPKGDQIQALEGGETVRNLKRQGRWDSKIGEVWYDIGSRFGRIIAQRYLEHCAPRIGDPTFDFEEYTRIFIEAQRQLGRLAGSYFSLSYVSMVDLGFTGEDYFRLVCVAKDANSKMFASRYAYLLPSYLVKLELPQEKREEEAIKFRVAAGRVYQSGKLNTAISFMYNSADAKDQGMDLKEFADTAIGVIDEFGTDTAVWIIRSMIGSKKMGYDPDRYIKDLRMIQSKWKKTAARWYAYGLSGIVDMYDEVKQNIVSRENIKSSPDYLKNPRKYDWLDENIKDQWYCLELFDPVRFKRNYLLLFRNIGRGAATFYSLYTHSGRGDVWGIESLDKLPALLQRFYSRVSKKVYHRALWFIPKMTKYPRNMIGLLTSTEETFVKYGQEVAIKSIAYTFGAVKRGKKDPSGLIVLTDNEELGPEDDFFDYDATDEIE